MSGVPLPGRLADIRLDGELPRHEDVPLVFDELDNQLASQAVTRTHELGLDAPGTQRARACFGEQLIRSEI